MVHVNLKSLVIFVLRLLLFLAMAMARPRAIVTILAVQLLGLPYAHAFTGSHAAVTRPALGAQPGHVHVEVAAASSTSADVASAAAPLVEESTYLFRDQFKIHAEASGPKDGQPVMLIHGFGCSTTYWRATRSTLVDSGYRVHAIDLLGQGKSAKPGRSEGVHYSINLWASIVDAYARDVVAKERAGGGAGGLFDGLFGTTTTNKSDGIVLMGNSLGSLVALSAALGDHTDNGNDSAPAYLPGRIRGLCFFNCGVGLNSRGIVDEPQWSAFQRFLFTTVLNTLDLLLFKNPPVLTYLLSEVVTKDLLRGALEGLYRYDPTRVDDELVDSFFNPARDEGAPEALGQIYTNDPGPSPMNLHEKHSDIVKSFPIHLIWGDDDAVTPLQGGVGKFYSGLANDETTSVTMDVVEGVGHIPFDDNPIECNGSMLRWIEAL